MNSLVVIYLEAEYVSLTDLECSRPAQFRSARHGSDGRRHLANRPHPVQYEEPTVGRLNETQAFGLFVRDGFQTV